MTRSTNLWWDSIPVVFSQIPKSLASVDIPGGKIGPGAHSVVFELHAPWLMRHRADADGFSVSSLDTGLFVSTDHVVILAPREFR